MKRAKRYGLPRRWPPLAAAAAAGAVVAGVVASVATVYVTSHHSPAAAVTVTATPVKSPEPQALETTKADRKTCQGWNEAGQLINEAAETLSVIPQGTSILDAEVRDNPERTAAVQHAADLFGEASDVLNKAITAGSTPILTEMAHATAGALAALATAYRTFDEASGDTTTVAKSTAHVMSGLCARLVP